MIWLQKVFVWLKRSLSGWCMLGSGSEGAGVASAPGELRDRLQGVMAGSTAWATSVFYQGPEHALVTFLAVEVWQQSFSTTPVFLERTEHWHRVWALWMPERILSLCKSSIPGGSQSTHLWAQVRVEGDGAANPHHVPSAFTLSVPRALPETTEPTLHTLSWTSPLARSYWCFVLN